MYGHVRSQFQWLLEVRGHEGVVHNQINFLAAADAADGLDIAHRHQRLGWRFDVDHTCALADGTFYVFWISGVDVGEFQTKVGQHLIAETRYAAVEIMATNDVVS